MEKLTKEYEKLIEKLPRDSHTLLTQIDVYIFGAMKILELTTEMYILAKEYLVNSTINYESEYSREIRNLKKDNTQVSIIKDLAKANQNELRALLYGAEFLKERAGLLRDIAIERLNTYKKIKSDNVNER